MENILNLQRSSFFEMAKGVNTAIPAHIVAFDPTLQRAQVQVAIQRVDVDGLTFTPAPIMDVPVEFAGGGYCVEFELHTGDEGLLVISQRCIDAWKNTGGVAINPMARFHDMQDAVFIPGVRSQKTAIGGHANNGIRLRDPSGGQVVWLKNDGSVSIRNGAGGITVSATGEVDINGAIFDTSGNLTTGAVHAKVSLTVAGKEMNEHVHSGVQTGNGNTGVPS